MNLVKLDLIAVCLSSLIALLLMIWNESSFSCGTTTFRVFETMFAIVALGAMREQAKISWRK